MAKIEVSVETVEMY